MERKVVRAKVMGFCMGVERAVNLVRTVQKRKSGKNIFTLGPIIHNPTIVKAFEKQGVKNASAEDPFQEDDVLVIRAHGVTPAIESDLKAKGLKVFDGTCPLVKDSQKLVKSYADKDYFVILVGDRDHQELKGVSGYAKKSIIISSLDEAKALENLPEKIVVNSQTTIKPDDYEAICHVIKEKFPQAILCNSICDATFERQAALHELLKEVECVVIVGGKNSANTAKLHQIAKENSKPSWLIESVSELPNEVFDYQIIGLTAGASTPEQVIRQVEVKILS